MAGCWEDEEDEEDEEEWSMRKLSRTRRMRMTPVATTTGTTMKNEKELGAQLKCPTSAFAILGAKIWFKSTKDLDTPSWTYLCFGNIRGVKRCKYHEAGEGFAWGIDSHWARVMSWALHLGSQPVPSSS